MSNKDWLQMFLIYGLAFFLVFWIPESHPYYNVVGFIAVVICAIDMALTLYEAAPQIRDWFSGNDWWY